MEKTLKFGGASYVFNFSVHFYKGVCVTAVARDCIIADDPSHSFLPNSIKIFKTDIINPNFLTEKLTIFCYDSKNLLTLVQYYHGIKYEQLVLIYDVYNDVRVGNYLETVQHLAFNGGTRAIPTTITLAPDGGLIMEFTDVVTGKSYSHKFPAP
jgi:hypothetical protein